MVGALRTNSHRKVGTGPRLRAVALAVLTITATACESSTGPDESGLDRNRAKWEALGILDYGFEFQLNCFCGGLGIEPIFIEVREGEATNVVVLATGESLDPGDQPVPTIDDLFLQMEEALSRDPHMFRAQYHPAMGYPMEVFIDFEKNAIDEEWGFTVRNLSVLE